MLNRDQIISMFDLQDKLNQKTIGDNWKLSDIAKTGRKVDFMKAFRLELAEAIESTNWKWWKNITDSDDIDNIKIEIVDMWHFLMSHFMYTYVNIMDNTAHAINIEMVLKQISDNSDESKKSPGEYLNSIECFADMIHAYPYTQKKIVNDLGVMTGRIEVSILTAFFNAVEGIPNFGIDELYKLYLGKNLLNIFRQDHGYSNGGYIKIWNGVEDNVVMQRLLNEYPDDSSEELLKALEIEYQNVIKNDS